jgi:hypothetical protein
LVARVLQAPSASLSYVKQLTEAAVSEFWTSKAVMAFHGAQKSPEDKKRLIQAVADPDVHMLANLMTHTSVIGPGVSVERPWYDTVVALAYNSSFHPDVFAFIQMLFRLRIAGPMDIYLSADNQRDCQPVCLPSKKEDVFRAIEDKDEELRKMLGSTNHLDFLVRRRGKRAICNRESATCVLYANNVLARCDNIRHYLKTMTKDLQKQGLTVIEKGAPRAESGEAPLQASDPDADLTAEEWREKYVVCVEQYSHLKWREERQDVSLLELKQIKLYEAIHDFYEVDPALVDIDFFDDFCKKDNKNHDVYGNYMR